MKIAIIGATGTIGSKVTAILLDRGHHVTAIARNPNSLQDRPGLEKRAADIFDFKQLRSALAGHEALVVAFAPKDNGYVGYKLLVEAAWRIKRTFKEVIPDAYFMNIGGASSLWTPNGFQMFEDPGWPHWFFNAAQPNHWARLHQLTGGIPAFKEMAEQRAQILADSSKDPFSNFQGPVIEAFYEQCKEIFGKGMGGRAQLEYFECDRSFRWSFISPPWLLGQTEAYGKYRVTIDTLPVEDGHPAGIAVDDLALAIADTVVQQSRVHQHWSAARPAPPGVQIGC